MLGYIELNRRDANRSKINNAKNAVLQPSLSQVLSHGKSLGLALQLGSVRCAGKVQFGLIFLHLPFLLVQDGTKKSCTLNASMMMVKNMLIRM